MATDLSDLRGRTAMARTTLSRPVALALNDGVLVPGASFFDYGCGRGGDLRRLRALGYAASGWDPIYYREGVIQPADVVNLGYVVNVIESPCERVEAVEKAWTVAREALIVAARLDWEVAGTTGRQHGDGVRTRAGTFQKFFTQEELRDWIEGVIGKRPVAASPGIFYVFRDDVRAQLFLASRVRRAPARARAPRLSEALYEAHRGILDPLVAFMESRGRPPEAWELHESDKLTDIFGSLRAATAVVRRVTGDGAWKAARAAAMDDLCVYLALAAFGGRPKYSGLPPDVQLDIRAFFGSYKQACATADSLLFRAGDRVAIDRACRDSTVGKRTPEALYVHTSAVPTLPPLLRVYEGCGRALTGAVERATIVKLNRLEAKISYLVYPDFDRDPHPHLALSVRADLRHLDIRVRDFREADNPPILHRKETFVAVDYPDREKFARLTAREERLGLLDEPAGIGTRDRWLDRVKGEGLQFRGHRLVRQPSTLGGT